MTEKPEYHSLEDALIAFGVPTENRAFVQRIASAIPLARFVRTTGYIRADRADGGPSLNISHGWTAGFRDEQEVIDTFGEVERWPSGRKPLWGVSHPLNRIGHGGGGPGAEERVYGICPRCHYELPATGACDRCDD